MNFSERHLAYAPATFQSTMDTILADVTWLIALVCLDDIIIFASSSDEYLVRVDTVDNLLMKARLKIQPGKRYIRHAARQVFRPHYGLSKH